MFQRDSFFLARLVNGRLDAGRGRDELSRLSPIFQPVAALLLAALPQERQPIWDDFLAGLLRPDPSREIALETHEPAALPQAMTLHTPAQPLAAASAQRPDEAERRVRLTCAVNVSSREVDWLWVGRVPLGMITMFAGDPKLGKSYVTLAMAAAISRGLSLPSVPLSDMPCRPGSVILMSAEDDPARTIVPRLTAAGADLAKIHILESVILANGSETLPSLRADIDAIMAAAAGLGDCRLIVIDPVSAYLKGVDDNRNAVLRSALTPLNRLAERVGAAVVLVSHLSEGLRPTASTACWGRSPTSGPAGRIISSSPIPATRPADACSCSIMAATWLRPRRRWPTRSRIAAPARGSSGTTNRCRSPSRKHSGQKRARPLAPSANPNAMTAITGFVLSSPRD